MLHLLLALSASAGTCGDLVREAEAVSGQPCLTVPLLGLQERADGLGCRAEVQAVLQGRGLQLPGARRVPVAPPPAPPDDKEVRDYWQEDYPHVRSSEHFVVKWGDDTSVDESDVQVLLDAFEHAWEVEVGEWGWDPPLFTDQYLFNVYIGDSGDGTPSSAGAAGYFTRDPAGYPFIVIAESTATFTESSPLTASHEFFHALQDATGTYNSSCQSVWIWEATAVWSEEELFPQERGASDFLPAWAFLPELPLNAFRWEDEGWYGSAHQYGAFLFPRYLSERHGGRDIVHRWWNEPTSGASPLRALDEMLEADGAGGVEDAFFGFLDAAATFDFERSEAYEEIIERAGGWDSSYSHRPVGTIRGNTDGWRQPIITEPYTFGAGYWSLTARPERALLEFEGDEGPRRWHVSVAWRQGDQHVVEVMEVDGLTGSLEVEGLDASGVEDVWIVVGVVDDYRDYGDTWGYRLAWTELATEPVDTGDEGGARSCACGLAPAGGAWVLLLAGVWIRRRRE